MNPFSSAGYTGEASLIRADLLFDGLGNKTRLQNWRQQANVKDSAKNMICDISTQLQIKHISLSLFTLAAKIAKSDYNLRHVCPSIRMKLGSHWEDFNEV